MVPLKFIPVKYNSKGVIVKRSNSTPKKSSPELEITYLSDPEKLKLINYKDEDRYISLIALRMIGGEFTRSRKISKRVPMTKSQRMSVATFNESKEIRDEELKRMFEHMAIKLSGEITEQSDSSKSFADHVRKLIRREEDEVR